MVFSETDFRNQVELLPLGFVIMINNDIVYANRSAARLLGKDSPDQVRGNDFAVFVHEHYSRLYLDELTVAKNSKVSWPLQVRLNQEKVNKYVEILVTYFIHEGQEAYQIVISDVTLKKNIESEMKKLLAQAFRSNKLAALGELVAGVAHEVNNPLSIIQTYLELIRDYIKSEPEPHELSIKALDKQEAAVKRISEIVRGLRSYAKGDRDNISDVDVHKAIESTVSLVSFIYKKQDILFALELDAQKSTLKANLGKLQQVFMNLFSNARDAIVESSRESEGKITVTSSNSGSNIVIKVSDNGMGIPAENLEKIFHSFFTTKDDEKGTGLGLSISYSFVMDLKGEITVDSQAGKGTTFTITLPVKD
ncbi:MAG: PAS domain S-box protein [Oligoflexia bacterium]|nr:PAS domain S-box protein [Oligoflexia bacterium]